MAKYICKSFKRTRTKICAKYGKGRKCIRKKTVSAKRCKDFTTIGKIGKRVTVKEQKRKPRTVPVQRRRKR